MSVYIKVDLGPTQTGGWGGVQRGQRVLWSCRVMQHGGFYGPAAKCSSRKNKAAIVGGLR